MDIRLQKAGVSKAMLGQIELLPGCEHLSPPHQAGVIEHVIVASGTVEVLVNHT
jgi:hypothetical protein